MIIISGLGVSEGIAKGQLAVRKVARPKITQSSIEDVDMEVKRYLAAKSLAYARLDEMYKSTLNQCGKEEAELFEVHKMMIEDDDFQESILEFIKEERNNAEYAVKMTSKKFFDMFCNMEDEYMRSRSEDVRFISRMLIDSLIGEASDAMQNILPGSILFAEDVSPGEVSKFKQRGIAGIISPTGSKTSHSSILARVMNMPAIVGVGDKINQDFFGKNVIIDGSDGNIYIEPDDIVNRKFLIRINDQNSENVRLEAYRGKESITRDGKKIDVYANMNNPNELDSILKSDAEGIGLFRTEFLYLNRDSYPTEEEQYQVYKDVAEKLSGKKLIIRTLDIGSDKKERYMNLPEEENPALGYRGIRVCLDKPEIFKTQLKAIYRASVYGNFSIMFPMISSVDELREAKRLVKQVQQELSENGTNFDSNIPIGVMIETPAAAILSDVLATEAEFFSIGTNDLTQYTLALDRQNSIVGKKFDADCEAVLRFIKLIVENAHKNGIKVGICGEMASHKNITAKLLELGIDELSVLPRSVLLIRERVINSMANSKKEERN